MPIRITQIGITQSCATVCVNPIQSARMGASRRRIESGSCQAVGRPSHGPADDRSGSDHGGLAVTMRRVYQSVTELTDRKRVSMRLSAYAIAIGRIAAAIQSEPAGRPDPAVHRRTEQRR
jgi:hypothetical protein